MADNTDDMSLFHLSEQYPDEASAILYFEEKRWGDKPTCPSCSSEDVFKGQPNRRLPLWRCKGCIYQFTVTSGTIMEGTKLPLRKWLFAFFIIGGSKKGVSAHYLSRTIQVTQKTAWHLAHRIRATMADDTQKFTGGIVESDETYIGGKRKGHGRGYRGNKMAVQVIVERSTKVDGVVVPGQVQAIALGSLGPDEKVDGRTVGAKLRTHTDPDNTILMTDESQIYTRLGKNFKEHHTVNHSKEEYVRQDPDGHLVHTNTAEGYNANLKRQINGSHHSVSKRHLPKYLEEHDYKYNTRDQTDGARTVAAIKNMEGKRLTLYKPEGGKGKSLIDHKASEPGGKRGGKRTDEE